MTAGREAGCRSRPSVQSVLAVCAHPDDESFGLGAVLDLAARNGANVAVLSFTRGEASTLGPAGAALHEVRRSELWHAAAALGVGRVKVGNYPDGLLAAEPLDRLAGEVAAMADAVGADLLLVFDDGGVTGHPDHQRATDAALAGAPHLPALAWAVPHAAAVALNTQFHTAFVGRRDHEIDLVLRVRRDRQRRAIACHRSQSDSNPVLTRRLELLGDRELLRWLRPPPPDGPGQAGFMNIRWTSSMG
jgi:N-acetylglucosamine malate deacetylase 2